MRKRNNPYHDLTDKEELEKEELKSKIDKLRIETEILNNQKSSQAQEQKSKIDKLDKENRVLENQLSERYQFLEKIKAYASAAGVFTPIVTVIALLFSVFQWSSNAKLTNEAKKEDRLTTALVNLVDTSSSKRLVGVTSLRSFITEGDNRKNSQALLSLSHALAIENDANIRSAILEVFRLVKDVQQVTITLVYPF